MGYIGILGCILGLRWDNGKENGNYYDRIGYILGVIVCLGFGFVGFGVYFICFFDL